MKAKKLTINQKQRFTFGNKSKANGLKSDPTTSTITTIPTVSFTCPVR